jgi:predicted DNA-binding helix-hairpin-helix protein
MDGLAKLGVLCAGASDEVAEDARMVQPALGVLPACFSGAPQMGGAWQGAFSPGLAPNSTGMRTAPAGGVAAMPSCDAVYKDVPVTKAALPGGGTITLLKTLQTSVCENDCYYCCFRRGRDFQRTTLTPDEMAQAFMLLYNARAVEGLFLSSGVAGGGVHTQDRLIATAEVLRRKHNYRGYIHLKIMPGAEHDQVLRAMQLADRVSVNLEAPNTDRLAKLAPHKTFLEELLQPLQWVDQIRKQMPPQRGWKGHWPSTTTQFVVGAVGESDLELLTTTSYLYNQVHLARAYYSGFSPVAGTPLEDHPAVNPWRQNRLYQASFLLRDYGFDLEEMPFVEEGNLPLGADPKLAWAQLNLWEKPVEVNRADKRDLIRVPGIGPKTAQVILDTCRLEPFHTLNELRRAGVSVGRAAPFILIDGKRPDRQMTLF